MNLKKEKEKLYSRNFTKYDFDTNVFVSIVTTLLVLAFSIFTILKPNLSAEFFANTNISINKNFNWLFVVSMNASLLFILFIGFSKFGNIRLSGYRVSPQSNHIATIKILYSNLNLVILRKSPSFSKLKINQINNIKLYNDLI